MRSFCGHFSLRGQVVRLGAGFRPRMERGKQGTGVSLPSPVAATASSPAVPTGSGDGQSVPKMEIKTQANTIAAYFGQVKPHSIDLFRICRFRYDPARFTCIALVDALESPRLLRALLAKNKRTLP